MSKINYMFAPKSIAVVGASNSEQKIGHAILKNIIDSGYEGDILPINPKEESIKGLKCYSSVKEAGAVEVVIISVPEAAVIDVAKECGEAGVKGLIVITAGFKEVGPQGFKLEKQLIQICEDYNMDMLGPNCVGLIDTHSPLNASFAPDTPLKGDISFISQSGAMLVSILDWSFAAGIGFSQFISLGNKANLNEVDFIRSSADDPNTNVILCYIEDVINGEHFLEVVKEASLKKPVIILKSGTSSAGAQAASSHTGALAGSDKAYDLSFSQTGVIRAKTMDDLFQQAIAFSRQPLPKGNRVAIVTNSGGPGIITTDAVEKSGLKMARFSKETTDYFHDNLPAEANIYNPVDILGDASAERYELALEQTLADENTDSVLVLFTPAAVIDPIKTAEVIININNKYRDKPIFVIFMGGKRLEKAKEIISQNNIPTYTFPEPAVRAIKSMATYTNFLKHSKKESQHINIEGDQTLVKSVLYDLLKEKRLVLLGDETSKLASAYGIPVNTIYRARNADEAAQLSEKVGYPVVMKISSHHIIHKTDVGGIKLGLNSPEEVKEAYNEMIENVQLMLPGTPVYGVEVQKMAEEGLELIIGVNRDVQFGPMVAFGLGGIYVNLIEDVSFNLANVLKDRDEIHNMIRQTKSYTLLRGYRGSEPYDIDALIDAIARVAKLVEDFPEIVEMDINPIRAYHNGATALDIKITISPTWED